MLYKFNFKSSENPHCLAIFFGWKHFWQRLRVRHCWILRVCEEVLCGERLSMGCLLAVVRNVHLKAVESQRYSRDLTG